MRRSLIAVVIVASLILGAGLWWYHYTGTPQYSLHLLAKAVAAKDYESARYFVDDERLADSISKSLVDTVTAQVTKDMEKDGNMFSGFGIAMIEMMTPRLREMSKEQVKDSIKQALSGNDTLTNKAGTKQADLKGFSSLKIQQCVVSGNTAEVLFDGLPQPNPFEQELRVRMAHIPNSRSWRIVEAPDAAQVFSRIFDEASLKDTPSSRQ